MIHNTKLEKRLLKKYTAVIKQGKEFQAVLVVGGQRFDIGYAGKHKMVAEWFAEMVAIALSRIVMNEKRGK